MSNSALLIRDEAPTRDPAWKPMASAPRDRLLLLKVPFEGGHWPLVGRYAHIHGTFCLPPIFGQNETALYPVAWASIPNYDGEAHV